MAAPANAVSKITKKIEALQVKAAKFNAEMVELIKFVKAEEKKAASAPAPKAPAKKAPAKTPAKKPAAAKPVVAPKK